MSELSTFNSLNRAATGIMSNAIELAAASFIDAENKEIDEMFERLRKEQIKPEINPDTSAKSSSEPITAHNSYRVSFKNEADFQSFQLQMKNDDKQIIASPVKIGDMYIAEVKIEDAAFINEYAKSNNMDITTFHGLDVHAMYSETGGRTESDVKDNLHENQAHAMSGVTNQLLMNCDTLGSAVFYARQVKDYIYDGSLTETIEYKFNNAEDMIKFNDAMKEAGIQTNISESALGSLSKAPEYKIELNIQTNSNNSAAIADSIDKMNTAQEILTLNGLDDKVVIKRQEFNAREHRGLLNGGAFDDYAKAFNKSMSMQTVNLGFDKDYMILNQNADTLTNLLDKMDISELNKLNKDIDTFISKYQATYKLDTGIVTEGYLKNVKGLNDTEKEQLAQIIGKAIDKDYKNIKDDIINNHIKKDVNTHIINNPDSVTKKVQDEINNHILTIKNSNTDSNIELLKSIDKRFNFNFAIKGNLTRQDILLIDKKFMELFRQNNINILDKRGRIDVNKINELMNTPKLLEKLNISKEQLEIFKATAVNPGGFNKNSVMGTISTLTNKLMSGDDPTGENQKTMQEINQMVTTAQRSKEVVKSIKKADQIRIGERRNIRKAKTPADGSKPHTTHSKPKKKKDGLSGKLTDRQVRQSKRAEAKLANKVKWADRYEKSVFGKFNNFKNKTIQKLAKTPIGQAIQKVITKAVMAVSKVILPALGAALGLLLAIVGVIDIISMVVLCISSLLYAINPSKWIDKALEPNSYADTVMYDLYEIMASEEEEWVKSLYDVDNLYKKKDSVKWGSAYTNLKAYCNSSSGVGGEYLKATGDADKTTITVSPFYFSVPDDVRTKVTKFEDEADVQVGANRSIYSTGTSQDGVNITAQSGHTSYIKDIVSMLDVNYNDINASDDQSLNNILKLTPAGLQWSNFKTNISNSFKWLGAAISQIWDDDAWTKFEEKKGMTVKYSTLKNYCMTLFEASHQEMYELEVSYDNIEDCDNKTTGNFYLAFYGNNLALQTVDTTYGGRYRKFITDLNCATNISTANIVDRDAMCLREDMGSNEDTYDFIKSKIGRCWYVDSDSATGNTSDFSSNSTSSSSTETITYDRYFELPIFQDTENINSYRSILDDILEDEDIYSGEEYDKFRAAYEETKEDAINAVNATFDEDYDEDYYKDVISERFNDWKSSDTYNFIRSNDCAMNHYYYELSDIDYSTEVISSETPLLSFTYYDDEETGERIHTCRLRVMATKRCKVYGETTQTQYLERLERNCQGHETEYCGGHVKVNSIGVVYSMTNEQVALSGMLKNEYNPVAAGYDIEANLGSEVYGKLDNVDYSSMRNAPLTGNNHSGIKDRTGKVNIQASQCSKGLNLKTKQDDSGMVTWDKEITVNKTDIRFAKDIFDIDMCINYGCNVFPIKLKEWQNFESWTSDNMTIAINKFASDWQELYGFDIPENIGMNRISDNDIEAIINALKAKYGDDFTETRQEAVKFALGWVGRGQYNNKHHDHGFLMDSHTGKVYSNLTAGGESGTFEFNCTATDCSGFGSFYLNHFGKIDHVAGTWELAANSTETIANGDYSNLLPGDLILKTDAEDHTMIFIGVLDDDLELNVSDGTKKVLTNGGIDYNIQNHLTLAKGQPITVDCAVSANASHKKGTATKDYSYTIGNIYLRGASSGYYKSYAADWLAGLKIRRFE